MMQQISRALNSRPVRIINPYKRPHAAVAVVLTEAKDGPHVLFIERAINENDLWSGQIAFPGGKCERQDINPRQTAERETREELGLDLSAARYLGRLSDIVPGGLAMVISSFVYAVERSSALHPDQSEVARVLWFPIREIGNQTRLTHVELMFRGRLRHFPALRLSDGTGQPLWGISYRLLRNLCKAARCA